MGILQNSPDRKDLFGKLLLIEIFHEDLDTAVRHCVLWWGWESGQGQTKGFEMMKCYSSAGVSMASGAASVMKLISNPELYLQPVLPRRKSLLL